MVRILCDLYCRTGFLGPPRSLKLVSNGFLEAPLGLVVVCFMQAVGVPTLTAWNTEVAQQSLQLFHRVVQVGRNLSNIDSCMPAILHDLDGRPQGSLQTFRKIKAEMETRRRAYSVVSLCTQTSMLLMLGSTCTSMQSTVQTYLSAGEAAAQGLALVAAHGTPRPRPSHR